MRVPSMIKRLGIKLSLNDPRWGSDKKDGEPQRGSFSDSLMPRRLIIDGTRISGIQREL